MAVTKDEIIEALKEMPALELSELVHELEDVFGVSAAAPVAVAAAPAAGGAAEGAAEEKTNFDVVLEGFGANKIAVSSLPLVSRRQRRSSRVLLRLFSRAQRRMTPRLLRLSLKRPVLPLPLSKQCLNADLQGFCEKIFSHIWSNNKEAGDEPSLFFIACSVFAMCTVLLRVQFCYAHSKRFDVILHNFYTNLET